MALPATRVITGKYTDPVTGEPLAGSVILSPYPAVWTDKAGNQLMLTREVIGLDSNGEFSQAVVRTDAPDVFPTTGKLWRFTENIRDNSNSGQNRSPAQSRTVYFEVNDGVGSIDITDLIASIPGNIVPDTAAGGDLTGAYPDPQLANTATARSNLGLGDVATRDVGLLFGNAADGEFTLSSLSTGVVRGFQIGVNGANPSAVDISAGVGYIVDNITDPSNPTITRVTAAAQTVPMDADALARAVTYWLMDSSGNVIQQAPPRPDPAQRRTQILLGVTAHTGGVIGVAETLPVILAQTGSQLVDLMDALGSFNMSGNEITPNGANLMLNHASGTMFARAFTHFLDGSLTNNPHVRTTIAQSPATFIQIARNTNAAPALTQTVDVANYDDNGVITPVGGGVNSATVLRVFLFANTGAQFQLVIQYGQTVYNDLNTAAAAAAAPQGFDVNPFFVQGNGVPIMRIAAIRTATDLSNPNQARFVTPNSKFALS